MKKNRKKYTPPEEEYTPQSLRDYYIELNGSADGYEAMLADIGEQLCTMAKAGYRFIMDGDEVTGVERPKQQRNERRRRS